jgi:hypothetical protein
MPGIPSHLAIGLAFATLVACAKDRPKDRAEERAHGHSEATHATPLASDASPQENAPNAPFVAGHAIVWPASRGGLAPSTMAKHRLVKLRDLSGGAVLCRIEGIDATTLGREGALAKTLETLESLRRDPAVASVEPNFLVAPEPTP